MPIFPGISGSDAGQDSGSGGYMRKAQGKAAKGLQALGKSKKSHWQDSSADDAAGKIGENLEKRLSKFTGKDSGKS